MRSITRATTMIIVIGMLVLLMGKWAWACNIVCSQSGCIFKCTPEPPPPGVFGQNGIGKVVIAKYGAIISKPKPPAGWKSALVKAQSGNELHLICPKPLKEKGIWQFSFGHDWKGPITDFVWYTLDAVSHQQLERANIQKQQ